MNADRMDGLDYASDLLGAAVELIGFCMDVREKDRQLVQALSGIQKLAELARVTVNSVPPFVVQP